MAGEANIWNPRTLIELSTDTKRIPESIIATAGQVTFNLSDFVYVTGTGGLEVYYSPVGTRGGRLLAIGVDYVEVSATAFSLSFLPAAGDLLTAVGFTGITGTVTPSFVDRSIDVQTIALAGQTVVVFSTIAYTIATNNLEVFRNGNLQTIGQDYTETSSGSITFLRTGGLNLGDRITAFNIAPTTNLVSTTAAISHVVDGASQNLATYLGNQRLVNGRDYGAIGDGVTDDTIAIQAMFTSGNPIHETGEFEYKTTATITIPNPATFEKLHIGGHLKLRPTNTGNCLTTGSSSTASTTVATSARIGRPSIVVASSAGMSVGDLIVFTSNRAWPYSSGVLGEINRIAGISGTTITVATPLMCEYTIPSDTVTAVTYKPKKVTCDGLDIKGLGEASGVDQGGVTFFGLTDSTITNIRAEGFRLTGVSINESYNVAVDNPTLIDCYLTGFGYGLQTTGCTHVSVSGGTGYRCRHAVDFSGNFPSHLCSMNGMNIVGHPDEGSCGGSHGPANMCSYRGNSTSGSPIAFQVRGPNSLLEGNTSFGHNTFAFINASGFSVINNNCPKTATGVNSTSDNNFGFFVQLADNAVTPLFTLSEQSNIISGNSAGVLTDFIRLSSDITAISDLQVDNNNAHIRNNSGGNNTSFMNALAAATVDAATVSIHDNNIKPIAGTYLKFRNMTYPVVDTVTDTAACSLDTEQSNLVTTTASVPTLADGIDGQDKTIYFKTDVGDAVLTPTNLHNGTTITFSDVGESAQLRFTDGAWLVVGLQGAVLA